MCHFPNFIFLVICILQLPGRIDSKASCGQNTVTEGTEPAFLAATRRAAPRIAASTRINAPDTGGEVVSGRGSWPWLASLGRFSEGEWRHFCGGSLITNLHVLTAAHCIVPDVTTVRLGDGDLDDDVGVQRRFISNSTIHPRFERKKPYFDVAILTLSSPANLGTAFVRTICLPTSPSRQTDEFDGDQMDVAGWGLTARNGFNSEVGELRQVQQKVFNHAFCNASHQETSNSFVKAEIQEYLPNLFTSDLMCAGYEFGGLGSCKGDSGGPLMKYTYDDGPDGARFVQQGVVQGGVGVCGSKDFPSIYVRLRDPDVLHFILDVITDSATKSNQAVARRLNRAVRSRDLSEVNLILSEFPNHKDYVDRIHPDVDNYLQTPVFYAAFAGLTEIVRALVVVGGANPEIRTGDGYTATYAAAQENHLEELKILVEQGSGDVNSINGGVRYTPLLKPVERGHTAVVEYLLRNGANKTINHQNKEGASALYFAAQNGRYEEVKLLVELGGADVEQRNLHGGWTALQKAADSGFSDIVRYLVEVAGADVDKKTGDGKDTAASYARKSGHRRVAMYLDSRGAGRTRIEFN